jgi:16S rRNA (adenine1518-N6/adenine1519-N6)-dimethyltransferase
MTAELPPLREVIAAHGLAAKKRFGQHFLLDLNITRKIARSAEVAAGDRVLDIGPGPGGLTRALLEAGAHVTAVEYDNRFMEPLNELGVHFPERLHVIAQDALFADERALAAAPVKIVANLPYNISTELLVKWLRLNNDARGPYWSLMALMFQKEVADRILAMPHTKEYGRLSIIAQAASTPRRAFNLPARAFTPPPKVDSTVVLFEPKARLTHLSSLEKLTQAAFSQRRKMLRTSLKGLFGEALEGVLVRVGIAPTSRAEDISVDKFLELAALI